MLKNFFFHLVIWTIFLFPGGMSNTLNGLPLDGKFETIFFIIIPLFYIINKEFSYIFNLKYIINRFGVISGPWQFGKVDQGFLSLFMWNFLNNKIIKFIGYSGSGLQERDILHIDDFCELILLQIKKFHKIFNKSFTAGGSTKNKTNLKKIYQICNLITNSKPKIVKIKKTSKYDIPYFNTSNKEVEKIYKWKVKRNIYNILNDIFKWQKENISNLKKIFND